MKPERNKFKVQIQWLYDFYFLFLQDGDRLCVNQNDKVGTCPHLRVPSVHCRDLTDNALNRKC